MPMRPLPQQVLIGLIVSLCVVGALAATWWTARPDASFATRLPAAATLAYAEFPAGDLPTPLLFDTIAPSLPDFPELDPNVTAVAAVHMPDGFEGWVTFWRDPHGTAHIGGTDPRFKALFEGPHATLASDRAFNAVRFDDGRPWAYVAFPTVPSEGSALSSLFTLTSPIAFSNGNSGTTLRLSLRPTPSIPLGANRPLVTLERTDRIVSLPPWNAMERIGTLLTPDIRTVAETLATTFVNDLSSGVSLEYDIASLLAGPSHFQRSLNASGHTIFSLEGMGRSSSETDRVLRLVHAGFTTSRGASRIRTVSAAGYSLRTISKEHVSETNERHDGAWTILETRAGEEALVSAHDGSHFVLTTDPPSLFTKTDRPDIPSTSRIALDDDTLAVLKHAWPAFTPVSDSLSFNLSSGPGYIQWFWTPPGL